MKKLLIAAVLFLFLSNCVKHYIRDPKFPSIDPALSEKMKSAKIAIVGFYPFRTFVSGSYPRSATVIAVLDYANPTSQFLPFGKPLITFKENGIASDVPESRIRDFVNAYLQLVKKSGKEELAKMIDFKKIDEKTDQLSLKKHEVDYYIVGYHGPVFQPGGGAAGFGQVLLTLFPFLLTAGAIPFWRDNIYIHSDFLVYDNQLNLVKKFQYKNSYTQLIWWFGNSEEDQDEFRPFLYKPDVIDFAHEFAESIGPQK